MEHEAVTWRPARRLRHLTAVSVHNLHDPLGDDATRYSYELHTWDSKRNGWAPVYRSAQVPRDHDLDWGRHRFDLEELAAQAEAAGAAEAGAGVTPGTEAWVGPSGAGCHAAALLHRADVGPLRLRVYAAQAGSARPAARAADGDSGGGGGSADGGRGGGPSDYEAQLLPRLRRPSVPPPPPLPPPPPPPGSPAPPPPPHQQEPMQSLTPVHTLDGAVARGAVDESRLPPLGGSCLDDGAGSPAPHQDAHVTAPLPPPPQPLQPLTLLVAEPLLCRTAGQAPAPAHDPRGAVRALVARLFAPHREQEVQIARALNGKGQEDGEWAARDLSGEQALHAREAQATGPGESERAVRRLVAGLLARVVGGAGGGRGGSVCGPQHGEPALGAPDAVQVAAAHEETDSPGRRQCLVAGNRGSDSSDSSSSSSSSCTAMGGSGGDSGAEGDAAGAETPSAQQLPAQTFLASDGLTVRSCTPAAEAQTHTQAQATAAASGAAAGSQPSSLPAPPAPALPCDADIGTPLNDSLAAPDGAPSVRSVGAGGSGGQGREAAWPRVLLEYVFELGQLVPLEPRALQRRWLVNLPLLALHPDGRHLTPPAALPPLPPPPPVRRHGAAAGAAAGRRPGGANGAHRLRGVGSGGGGGGSGPPGLVTEPPGRPATGRGSESGLPSSRLGAGSGGGGGEAERTAEEKQALVRWLLGNGSTLQPLQAAGSIDADVAEQMGLAAAAAAVVAAAPPPLPMLAAGSGGNGAGGDAAEDCGGGVAHGALSAATAVALLEQGPDAGFLPGPLAMLFQQGWSWAGGAAGGGPTGRTASAAAPQQAPLPAPRASMPPQPQPHLLARLPSEGRRVASMPSLHTLAAVAADEAGATGAAGSSEAPLGTVVSTPELARVGAAAPLGPPSGPPSPSSSALSYSTVTSSAAAVAIATAAVAALAAPPSRVSSHASLAAPAPWQAARPGSPPLPPPPGRLDALQRPPSAPPLVHADAPLALHPLPPPPPPQPQLAARQPAPPPGVQRLCDVLEVRASIRRLSQLQERLDSVRAVARGMRRRLEAAVEGRREADVRRAAAERARAERAHWAQRAAAAAGQLAAARAAAEAQRGALAARARALQRAAGALQSAEQRRLAAEAELAGPGGRGQLAALHAALIGRRNRLVAALGRVFQVGPVSAALLEPDPLDLTLDSSWAGDWARQHGAGDDAAGQAVSGSGGGARGQAAQPARAVATAGVGGGGGGSGGVQRQRSLQPAVPTRLAVAGLEVPPDLIQRSLEGPSVWSPLNLGRAYDADQRTAASLGYLTAIVDLAASYLGVPLRYPVVPRASVSYISDPVPPSVAARAAAAGGPLAAPAPPPQLQPGAAAAGAPGVEHRIFSLATGALSSAAAAVGVTAAPQAPPPPVGLLPGPRGVGGGGRLAVFSSLLNAALDPRVAATPPGAVGDDAHPAGLHPAAGLPLFWGDGARDRTRFAYGVYLLCKDLEQLLEAHGIPPVAPNQPLQNLYALLTAAASGVPDPGRGGAAAAAAVAAAAARQRAAQGADGREVGV